MIPGQADAGNGMSRFGQKNVSKRRLAALLLALIGGALGAWLWGLVKFVDTIPESVTDKTSRTDAIIVLTGGTLRVEKGFELLSSKLSDKLLISGVDKRIQLEEVLGVAGVTPAELECCVTLGYMAEDTGSNAAESAAWIRTNNINSVRLVTSSYHMPRSLLEFGSATPGVRIIPHPVFPEHVIMDEWWSRPGTASLVIAEYNKYLLAAVRRLLSG